jgi:outer membrane protein OmpA-like peptidoglycan-associated protein
MTTTQIFDAEVRRFDVFKLVVAGLLITLLGLLTIPGASHGPVAQAAGSGMAASPAETAPAPTLASVTPPSPVAAQAPSAPPPVVAQAPDTRCEQAPQQAIVVNFATDSATLSSASLTALQKWSACFAGKRLQVTGHADARGSDEHNLALSESRAKAVAQQLEQAGLSADLIVLDAQGEAQPLDPANTPQAWAKNRRVEVRLL